VIWEALLQQLTASWPVRGLLDGLVRGRARRKLVDFDHESAVRAQLRTLRGLVHRAQSTRFGRDHDFRRIRTVSDFQRLVPLRTLPTLWHSYWPAPGKAEAASPAFSLDNTTWPHIPFVTYPESTGARPSPVPLALDLVSAHGKAALTALGLIANARAHARLFSGSVVVLGRETEPMAIDGITTGSWEQFALRRLPRLLRSSVRGPLDVDRKDDPRLHALCAPNSPLPVMCLAGSADRLARLFALVQARTGRDRIVDVWPELAAVLYTRSSAGPDRTLLRDALGSERVLLLEVWLRPEGTVAIEDPRYNLLRLLPDHGVFFEFIPQDQLGQSAPVRHSLGEVERGVPYALALTAAGVWACVVEGQLVFERRQPPLLHLLEQVVPVAPLMDSAHPFPVQPPHVRMESPQRAP
jgi:hypothetical protein